MSDTPFPNTAVFGLAVMGSNLARNIESRGYGVTVYNRTSSVTEEFIDAYPGASFVGAMSLEELVEKTASPRKIILMIKAGPAVDTVLDQLVPMLSEGDIVIDGGNALYTDTNRRVKRCAEQKIHFLGVGISGGEEGALNGPSIMPGGAKEAWELCSDLFAAIAAKVDKDPCTDYIGPEGSGHFVKMVHNGIEYADMQLIAEAYHIMKSVLQMSNEEMSDQFAAWNEGRLASYLMEITAQILRKRDCDADGYLVDAILDKAGQKGTGRWTVQEALELGIPIPTIAAAVDARGLSALKDERVASSKQFSKPSQSPFAVGHGGVLGDRAAALQMVEQALYCGKVVAYAQGMALIEASSEQFKWDLKLDRIASLWRGGCIIRASLLSEIMDAYRSDSKVKNLVLHPKLKGQLEEGMLGFRSAVAAAALTGVPLPGLSSALSYLESYTTADLPQNLIQGQRDFFGAHTYQRKDKEGTFHTEW
ncbi:MAG: NADP-dependent phosphogluconate dehydrogenase [Bdellovibrionales bacterium]|nr:NADP-dependent phosphogluconate dehydrogenase [Bdellovibrionales bacterium]